jgi:hypothetical protein
MVELIAIGAKGAAAHRQGEKKLARPFGGALDTATVLRVFLKEVDFPGFRVVS